MTGTISGEWINSWVYEIHDMGRIGREAMLVQLAAVITIDKQAQGTFECKGTARETTRRSGQTSQIVSQLGIIPFDGVGIGLPFRHFISAEVIPEAVIHIKGIAVIVFGFGGFIHHLLDGLLSAFPDYFPAQITARVPVYAREDVDPVFLLPIKVNNSSISASFTSSGKGASGKLAACAWTQDETVP